MLSTDPYGASPGRPNERSLFQRPAPGALNIEPRTFSPADGQSVTVSFTAEPGVRVVVGVYDVEGRRLTELGSSTVFPVVFVWDGRDSNGNPFSPGLYIVAGEVYGAAGGRVGCHRVVVGCGPGRR
jgi:hypothetical protein